MQFTDAIDECSAVTKLEELAIEWELNSTEEPLGQVLMLDPPSNEEVEEYLALLKANSKGFTSKVQFGSLELSSLTQAANRRTVQVRLKGCEKACEGYRLFLEETENVSIEGQRSLIQSRIFDTGKLKPQWLKAGIIYPIYDKFWMDLVQYAPKE
ncbi:hypothetical protein EPI10_005431 [Gossypium australe]|uniref:Uncharacterized protein n=1 Tax=Gossypium australe TaxID=47621 RepID=A0A5B6WN11_9ROSI|nr:hypothetical protein EPI10_005431 [Gossypium australe]